MELFLYTKHRHHHHLTTLQIKYTIS